MYTVRKNPPESVRALFGKYDPLTQRLLHSRGILTEQDAECFLKKEWAVPETERYAAMEKAVQRIADSLVKKETVGIYSDYDCDGIPAAAALYSTLKACGHESVVYYVPDRNKDGFGLNAAGIRHMIDRGVSVVCVLDCGTADPEGVCELEAAGIAVIIIDHHLPGPVFPEPFAMINPVTEESVEEPYPCAAGAVYLFIQALVARIQDLPLLKKPKPGWEKWQLDVVGLATLSDMVPLRGINRQLAHYGIAVMRKSPRPGIRALCALLRIRQENISRDDITYRVIPCINAASRMGDARLAFTLLTAEVAEASEAAEKLVALNAKRKTAAASMVRSARGQARHKGGEKDIWVFGDRKWKPSLAGLVAQKLSEAYGKTVFVWGRTEGDAPSVKGSCRSSTHDIVRMMRSVPDLFVESGGHKRAGGFTLAPGAELVLEEKLNSVEAEAEETKGAPCVDYECRIDGIPDALKVCGLFEPFGAGNDPVRIAIPECRVAKFAVFGKKNEHRRYVFTDGTGSIDGVSFFAEEDGVKEGMSVRAVIGFAERDTYRGVPRIRVEELIT